MPQGSWMQAIPQLRGISFQMPLGWARLIIQDDWDIFFPGAVRLHDLCPFPGIKTHEARDKI